MVNNWWNKSKKEKELLDDALKSISNANKYLKRETEKNRVGMFLPTKKEDEPIETFVRATGGTYGNPKIEIKVIQPPNRKEMSLPFEINTNNMHLIQRMYSSEFNGEVAIYIEGLEYLDFSNMLYKKVNYNYYGAYLKKMGKYIAYCNPEITGLELLQVLLGLFNFNVRVPTKLWVWDDYRHLKDVIKRIENISSEVLKNEFNEKLQRKNKVVFNPDYELTKEDRISITNQLTGQIGKEGRIDKMIKLCQNWDEHIEGKMTQKKIAEKTGFSLRSINTYMQEMNAAI